jgi:hypothetical protein
MTCATELLRYVPHSLCNAYEAMGWVWVADMPGHHAAWAVLMMWCGNGEAREPLFAEVAAE